MSRITSLGLSVAVPAMLFSQAAFADLTPQDVWSDWRSYMEGVGYQIDANETARGDNLTVSNINLNFTMPDDSGAMSLSLGSIDFLQNGDGTVSIILPGTMPFTISGTDGLPGGEEFEVTMTYAQTDHAMTASGSPEQMTYLYTAGAIAMDLTDVKGGDQTLGPENAKVSLAGTNLSTTTTMTIGDVRGYDQTGSIESLSYDVFFRDPEQGANEGTIKGSVNGVSIAGKGSIPLEMVPGADVAAMMAAGFDVEGQISYAAGSSDFDIKDPRNGDFVMSTSSQGGSFGVKMAADGLDYDVVQQDVNVNLTAQSMPFPVQFAMAQSGFKLAMPVRQSDTPQDFALGLTLGDFTMSDMIWGIFDPAAQLPRDPATVMLDLTGKVKLLVDLLNPEDAAEITGTPGELKSVNLGNLLVAAAGAKLEGNGGVTFDGAGPAMVQGLGNPVGAVNFALAGGNGLLDKLVAMGLLPQEQAMGARMMMGLFALPGEAPDTLKSTIEFTQGGQILANGQRIR